MTAPAEPSPRPTSDNRELPWRAAAWADLDLFRLAGDDRETPVATGLRLARDLEPLLGADSIWPVFAALATLGSADLTLARAAEPHLDAVEILRQADLTPAAVGAGDDATWGVYAARAPGLNLQAERARDGWVLTGDKPWCSLADQVSHALVTADAADGYRLLSLDLRSPQVEVDTSVWHARGLTDITTSTMHLTGAAAYEVGGPGWYLDRPGFAWGGIGVAAVWFGGAAWVAGRLAAASARREPDQIALMHLGECDRALSGALATLRDAARQIDADPTAAGPDAALLAVRVRSVVAEAAEQVLTRVGHALGPGPLAHDADHAAHVADLTIYLRQHHGERDLAALGQQLLDETDRS